MLLAGDEFGRTQRGNNNAYCQDNEVSWLDWQLADSSAGREFVTFVRRLIALRREHAALRASYFLHGQRELAPAVSEIAWFDERGEPIPDESWKNPELRLLSLRRAAGNENGTISILTLLLNPTAEDHSFRLPEPNFPARISPDIAKPEQNSIDLKDPNVAVHAHCVVLADSQLERTK